MNTLPDSEHELVCLAVDGELTASERPAFQALIAKSLVAKELYVVLCEQRDRLRQFAVCRAPKSFAESVMVRVRQLPSHTHTTPAKPKADLHRRTVFLSLATAASFFLLIGSASFYIAQNRNSEAAFALQILALPSGDKSASPPVETSILVADRDNDMDPVEFEPIDVAPSVAIVEKPATTPVAKIAPANPGTLLGSPLVDSFKPFDSLRVQLPMLIPFSDIQRDDAKESLRNQLVSASGTRIDLFAKDTAKAAELLIAFGKSHSISTITETIAGERMKRKMPSTWILYTDMLTATEVSNWLSSASTTTPQLATRLHVVSGQQQERKDLRELLGIDLAAAKKPEAATPNQSLAAGTIDQVASNLQKATKPEKSAILLTYLPPLVRAQPSLSKDVKQYQELRKDRQPGTVSVMIVIRPTNID